MQFDMIMKKSKLIVYNHNIDGLAGLQQKRRESISKAPELRLFIMSSICVSFLWFDHVDSVIHPYILHIQDNFWDAPISFIRQ